MGLTDYEKYIRTEELLALQKSPETLTCHDELQFQIVHQVAELWLKLTEHDMTVAKRALELIEHAAIKIPSTFRLLTTDSTRDLPMASDLLDRQFNMATPDRV